MAPRRAAAASCRQETSSTIAESLEMRFGRERGRERLLHGQESEMDRSREQTIQILRFLAHPSELLGLELSSEYGQNSRGQKKSYGEISVFGKSLKGTDFCKSSIIFLEPTFC